MSVAVAAAAAAADIQPPTPNDLGHHCQSSITECQGSVLHDILGDDNEASVADISEIADDEHTTTATDVPDDVTESGKDQDHGEDKENGPTSSKEGGVNKVLKSGVFGGQCATGEATWGARERAEVVVNERFYSKSSLSVRGPHLKRATERSHSQPRQRRPSPRQLARC